jgi:hypothetical protein
VLLYDFCDDRPKVVAIVTTSGSNVSDGATVLERAENASTGNRVLADVASLCAPPARASVVFDCGVDEQMKLLAERGASVRETESMLFDLCAAQESLLSGGGGAGAASGAKTAVAGAGAGHAERTGAGAAGASVDRSGGGQYRVRSSAVRGWWLTGGLARLARIHPALLLTEDVSTRAWDAGVVREDAVLACGGGATSSSTAVNSASSAHATGDDSARHPTAPVGGAITRTEATDVVRSLLESVASTRKSTMDSVHDVVLPESRAAYKPSGDSSHGDNDTKHLWWLAQHSGRVASLARALGVDRPVVILAHVRTQSPCCSPPSPSRFALCS